MHVHLGSKMETATVAPLSKAGGRWSEVGRFRGPDSQCDPDLYTGSVHSAEPSEVVSKASGERIGLFGQMM